MPRKRGAVPGHGRGVRQRLVALGGLVVIVGAVLAVLFAAGVLGSQGGGGGTEPVALLDPPPAPGRPGLEVGPRVGRLAPDFEISDFDGNRYRLSDFRGKVVYVNFWATWCGPCQVEIPDMFELLQRHEGELVIISVNRREPVDRARTFLANIPRLDGGVGVSFTVDGIDPDDTLYRAYRGLGMPVSVFIDPDGVVTRVYNGLITLPQMEEAVAEALQSPSAADLR